MNWQVLLMIAVEAMWSLQGLSFIITSSPQCVLSAGERYFKCDKNARAVEILSIRRPGERELRCEVIEMYRDGEWQVLDYRLYCRRVSS